MDQATGSVVVRYAIARWRAGVICHREKRERKVNRVRRRVCRYIRCIGPMRRCILPSACCPGSLGTQYLSMESARDIRGIGRIHWRHAKGEKAHRQFIAASSVFPFSRWLEVVVLQCGARYEGDLRLCA